MLGGINTSALSQLYRTQTNEYSGLMTQIASGKKINKPSDDFVGYTRAQSIQTDISGYESARSDLFEAKEAAQMASDVGNGIYEDLSRMKELDTLYQNTTDTDEQDSYQAEYDALKASITDFMSNNKYNGVQVASTSSSTLSTVTLDPSAGTNSGSLTVAFDESLIDVSSYTIGTSDMDAALDPATAYAVKAEGYLSQIDRQIEIGENLTTSKENTLSAVEDIDEVKALAEATQLQVRQQASVSMIAQANLMAGSVARLYQ